MPGVAHTTGSEIYKEIHFSLEHIVNSAARAKDEINGVLTHEVVHCFQHNGHGTAPGGLIEGIAGLFSSPFTPFTFQFLYFAYNPTNPSPPHTDYVRLRSSLAPPHWHRRPSHRWDEGYDCTAYFLDWLDTKYGPGVVSNLNLALRERTYDERVWKEVVGKNVGKLWKRYCDFLELEKGNGVGGGVQPPPPVPTHNKPGQEVQTSTLAVGPPPVSTPFDAVPSESEKGKPQPQPIKSEEGTKDVNMEDEGSQDSTDSEIVVVEGIEYKKDS